MINFATFRLNWLVEIKLWGKQKTLMNTFNYNTSNVNHYVTTDLGSLGDAPTSIVDNGETAYDLVVSGDYIVTGDILVNFFNEEDYQEINFTETTYPFGTFKVSNTTDSAAAVVFISKPEPIKLYQKAIVVRNAAQYPMMSVKF